MNVAYPDLSPLAAVTLVSVVASGEVIIVLLHQFLMRGAVLFAVLTEPVSYTHQTLPTILLV